MPRISVRVPLIENPFVVDHVKDLKPHGSDTLSTTTPPTVTRVLTEYIVGVCGVHGLQAKDAVVVSKRYCVPCGINFVAVVEIICVLEALNRLTVTVAFCAVFEAFITCVLTRSCELVAEALGIGSTCWV
jgi:hypothetical protein